MPKVLLVYYTYTQQARLVVDAMAEVFRDRGCGVGTYVDGVHYKYEGGQIRSLLSLISYLGTGENRSHYLGVPIPPTNLKPPQLDDARGFAGRLADQLDSSAAGAS